MGTAHINEIYPPQMYLGHGKRELCITDQHRLLIKVGRCDWTAQCVMESHTFECSNSGTKGFELQANRSNGREVLIPLSTYLVAVMHPISKNTTIQRTPVFFFLA